MAPEDQMKILNAVGEVPPEYSEKLRALKHSTLNNNPAIKIVHGKIDGIFELLPVIDQGPVADSVIGVPVESDTPVLAQSKAEIAAQSQADLKVAAGKFFNSVRVRKWSRALDYLDESEKSVFEQGNGKLTGLVLIVPSLSSVSSGEKSN
ncbi:MAG: hypothetical protein ABI036_05265 [Fibrobacteria bacterium]